MRTLRFIVENGILKEDPSCDFTGLFPGKNPEIQAKFTFSKEWDNTVKVAAFWSMLDSEYEPQALQDGACIIPAEALTRASFKIQVIGKKTRPVFEQQKLSTNKLTIRQTGGKR